MIEFLTALATVSLILAGFVAFVILILLAIVQYLKWVGYGR